MLKFHVGLAGQKFQLAISFCKCAVSAVTSVAAFAGKDGGLWFFIHGDPILSQSYPKPQTVCCAGGMRWPHCQKGCRLLTRILSDSTGSYTPVWEPGTAASIRQLLAGPLSR